MKATLLLARTLAYPDLITCSKILSVDRLASRILGKRSEMNQWIVEAFSQFTSAAGSEKTVMSIQSTAQLIFNRLQIPEVLSVLCGQSTIPTQLTGKTMLVLGLAQEKRNVLAPLLAAIINLLVNRNMARPRQEPLFVILDELSTLYLPYLKNWPNEHRSQGLCLIVGVQNKTQLEGIYGQVDARTIIGAFGTRIYFNPQDIETANWIAKSLPEKEVVLKSRNRSVSGGKVTHTYSEDVRTKPLMSGARINQMKTGEAILINPHFASPQWGFIPIHRQIVLSRRYQRLNNWCESTWSNYLEAALIKAAGKHPAINEQDLILRQKAVEQLFPDSLVKKTNDNIPDLLSRLL